MQAARGAYRDHPKPKFRDTSTNPDNGEPTRLSTSHSYIPELPLPPVEQPPVPVAELLQPGRGPLHTLVPAEKVCNQGCRKICLSHRDFLRDQYAAPGHGCYNR